MNIRVFVVVGCGGFFNMFHGLEWSIPLVCIIYIYSYIYIYIYMIGLGQYALDFWFCNGQAGVQAPKSLRYS